MADRLDLRLERQLPVNEGLCGVGIAAGLENGDRLGDGGDPLLRKDEIDRRSLRLGIVSHVFDDDPVRFLAARNRLNHGAVAPCRNGAALGQRFEIAPAEFRLLYHRADMDDGSAGIERMRQDGLAGGRGGKKIVPRTWRCLDQVGVDDDAAAAKAERRPPVRLSEHILRRQLACAHLFVAPIHVALGM